MALGFSSSQRLDRLLLKTKSILGEGDETIAGQNKAQALQTAASFYGLYTGDGSETTYTDSTTLTIMQSEMIATAAAIDLISSAISYYKEDVVQGTGGPTSFAVRTDKLNWLQAQLTALKEKLGSLESANGYSETDDLTSLVLHKVMACADPAEDVCCTEEDLEAFESTVGVTS